MTAESLSIALVTDWCPPRVGGVERHVAGLARALAARGHRVHLVTTTADPSPMPGVTIHPIQTAMIGDVAAPALWKVSRLRTLLEETGVDVVHAHGMFSTLAIGSLIAADTARIPSVTTHHSLLRGSPTLPAAWATYRLFSRRATMVTAVSRAAAADARRASGRSDVALLPNGLDRATWTAAARPPEGVARVVSVMRLARKKSPGDLIDVVPAVLARVARPVVFTVVGDGPERSILQQRVQRLGLTAVVELAGARPPDEVAALLARSTLFALPSRREAFGIVLLEARAARLPIVARASGGVPEIVEHGRHGLLADTRDEFGDAIATLLSDERLRQRCAAAAADGLEAYDWGPVVERHEAVYRRAVTAFR